MKPWCRGAQPNHHMARSYRRHFGCWRAVCLCFQQHLDDADVGLAFEQVGGEAVPERVHRHALVEPGGGRGGVDDMIELARRDGLSGLLARDQPAARALHPPPGPQDVEDILREHHVAVLAPLALLDADQHARAVDVADLEVDDLRHAQAAAVGDAEGGPVLQPWRAAEQPRHLLGAQHDRQALGGRCRSQAFAETHPAERDLEEEPQGRHRGIYRGGRCALGRHMQLEAAQILGLGQFGRPAEEGCEGPDVSNIVGLRLRGEVPDRHVFDHAAAQRADGVKVRAHGVILSGTGLTPRSSDMPRGPPISASRLPDTPTPEAV